MQTSEWDVRAIIAYAQIHHKKRFDKVLKTIEKWDDEKVNNYFKDKTFSLNSKVPGNPVRKDRNFKINLIAANTVNNNYPDITKVDGNQIKDIDLLTYSFPCQGLSIANMGRDKGIKEDAASTSNLIWQIRKILISAKEKAIDLPKCLLMENVTNLLSKKHIEDYKRWLEFLSGIGYTTKTIVLNGFNHGSLQKRKRVFAVSMQNWKNEMTDSEFQEYIDENFNNRLTIAKRKNLYKKILTSSDKYDDEIFASTPNDTPSRVRMATENPNLFERTWRNGEEYTFSTLTTKQDRNPNIGMIEVGQKFENKLEKRFITPREAYLIMGFDNNDFNAVKSKWSENIITKESLYRQAGNSIVVPVLEDIFKCIREILEVEYEIS